MIETLIIIYLLISIMWLIIGVIVGQIYKRSLFWIPVFIIITILYIPLVMYYEREGRVDRVWDIVIFTIGWFVLYVIVESALAIAHLSTVIN